VPYMLVLCRSAPSSSSACTGPSRLKVVHFVTGNLCLCFLHADTYPNQALQPNGVAPYIPSRASTSQPVSKNRRAI
jgi:hypothetical protein